VQPPIVRRGNREQKGGEMEKWEIYSKIKAFVEDLNQRMNRARDH